MGERLKGQETSVNIMSTTNGLETSFSDIKNSEFQFDRDILSEGYLGQTTEQKDDIFKGVSGKIVFHSGTADIMGFVQRLNEISKGRLPGESIQVVSTLRFPNGTRRVIFANCAFGNIPINNAGRENYVEFTLEFASDDGRVIAAA